MSKKANTFKCDYIKQWLIMEYKNAKHSQNKLTPLIIELLKQAAIELKTTQTNVSIHSTILDVRTISCALGNCDTNNRNHFRLTTYNINKIINPHAEISTKLKKIVTELTNLWKLCKTNGCYLHPKPTNTKFLRFVKETNDIEENKINITPIEDLFTLIDEIAEENTEKTKRSKVMNAPGQKITKENFYRMSYGDLNYLGNNKAIFYFDRGKRGKQVYTNSMYSIKNQSGGKDIVVIDDIVFTSNCKCDSFKQHLKMFPHYRVTIAAGLTCPARLTTMEKIIFARTKNASMQTFTSARAMLVRYW